GNVVVKTKDNPAVSVPVVVERFRHNAGNQQESIILPDSSIVTLYANSSIRYPEPFDKDKRVILLLAGKAVFKVVTDETRPFTVTAGPVITTVLGTEFSMMEEKGDVTVQLFSGKVRLHGTQKWRKDIVLSPGEQLSYTGMGKEIVVSRFDEDKLAQEQEAEPIPVEEQEIEFDDEPLPQVMDKLASCYHLNLTYNKKQIANMYFTGTVTTSDSITTILRVIANMNELKIVPAKKGFIIRKIIP
ncbi:MAG TPA: FecR domain-containing protein, partial [Puia sp.]|nr:FecR domain-containing protein [Puia sp.]